MTLQDPILLPSQEALLQRLHHTASYSERLLVLCGARGSGKTTLVTALATRFDDINTALVICPMHAEHAEIRRKILIQLMSSPIFDDEIPLADTLLRVAKEQVKPLHIIIDDAHLLPKALWAECIILNQIQCAGKPISVTLTVSPEFLAALKPQLPANLRGQLLPVNIDPLSVAEREALYQTLLTYCGQNPATSRNVVRSQLETQSGTPEEVANLLELVLFGQPTKQSFRAKHKQKRYLAIVVIVMALSPLFFVIRWPFTDLQAQNHAPLVGDVSTVSYGERALQAYFDQRKQQEAQSRSPDVMDTKTHAIERVNPIAAVPTSSMSAKESDIPSVQVELVNMKEDFPAADTQVPNTITHSNSHSKAQSPLNQYRFNSSKPRSGYTIQIMSVTQLSSLDTMLATLANTEELFFARHGNGWVLLVGHYADRQLAEVAANLLSQRYQLDKPWIRKWHDLNKYQLQEYLSSRETLQ